MSSDNWEIRRVSTVNERSSVEIISTLARSLTRLVVSSTIKIAVITHKALSTSVPPYIDKLLQRQVTTRSLRSTTDAQRIFVPWTRIEAAKWAFSGAAPNVWNSLPNDVGSASSLSTFLNPCQTENIPFTVAYSWWTYPSPRLRIDF